jgi:hypothetical protein
MERDSERRTRTSDSAHQGEDGDSAICPFCGSRETELLSPFGSQLSTAQYLCRACRSPFERIRQDEPQGRC